MQRVTRPHIANVYDIKGRSDEAGSDGQVFDRQGLDQQLHQFIEPWGLFDLCLAQKLHQQASVTDTDT